MAKKLGLMVGKLSFSCSDIALEVGLGRVGSDWRH
jgi:hypothetical protein